MEVSAVRQEDLKWCIFSFKHQIDCHRTEMHYEKKIFIKIKAFMVFFFLYSRSFKHKAVFIRTFHHLNLAISHFDLQLYFLTHASTRQNKQMKTWYQHLPGLQPSTMINHPSSLEKSHLSMSYQYSVSEQNNIQHSALTSSNAKG